MSYRQFMSEDFAKSFACVCGPSETLALVGSLRPGFLFSSIEMFAKKFASET